MAQLPVSAGQSQVTPSLSQLLNDTMQCACVSLFGYKFLSLFSVPLIVLTLAHNLDLRDSHEYIQKQIFTTQHKRRFDLLTLVAHLTYLENICAHNNVAELCASDGLD